MPKKRILLKTALVLFTLFVYFSFLVHKGAFSSWDFDTTVRLQDHLPRSLDLPFSVLTLFGSVEVTGLIWLGFLIYFLIKKSWLTILSLSLFFISLATELYGKLFVYHPGPPFLFYRGVFGGFFPSSYLHTNYSYPSGHATRVTFLIVFLMLLIFFKLKLKNIWYLEFVLLVFLLLMYVSRVYLGEHWASDVIGGALLGGSLGILSSLALSKKSS